MANATSGPRATGTAKLGALLLAVAAALDLSSSLLGGGEPYVQAGTPPTVLGAVSRALTAGILAYALLTGRTPVRRYAWVVGFGLIALWAPRAVWIYTARHPALDPWAPALSNLLLVASVAVLAGAFLRSAAEPPSGSERFWGRQLRGGIVLRLAAILPLAGYMLQAKLALGDWGARGRAFLVGLGLAWWAVLAACFAGGIAWLLRRQRAALWGVCAAVVVYLMVRLLAGDLGAWSSHLISDFRLPFGPLSLFAVRASSADTAGGVAFSCALLAFSLRLALERPRPSRDR